MKERKPLRWSRLRWGLMFICAGGLIAAGTVAWGQWRTRRAIQAAGLLRSRLVRMDNHRSVCLDPEIHLPFLPPITMHWPSFLEGHPDLQIHTVQDDQGVLGGGVGYRSLLAFPKLGHVELAPQEITDELVEVLARCPQLRSLTLHKSELKDEDLKKLARVTQLTALELGELRVSDEGLKALGEFPRLAYLSLDAGKIEGNDFEPIVKGMKLKRLVLTGEGFGDQQMESLSRGLRETRLPEMSLSSHAVTDDGMRHLGEMKNVESLHFTGTKFGDDGLMAVAKIGALKGVTVFGAPLSVEGVRAFKKARPDVGLSLSPSLNKMMRAAEMASGKSEALAE